MGAGLRVKICGITNLEDGIAAAEAGADAIGLNFVGGPRQITAAVAKEILRALPPMVTPVALVKVESWAGLPPECAEVLGEFHVHCLQLYGWELTRPAGAEPAFSATGEVSPSQQSGEAFVRSELERVPGLAELPLALAITAARGFRAIPALAVKDLTFAERLSAWGSLAREWRPHAVVLDAYDPAREGGTGRTFQWEWVARARAESRGEWPPVFLAGGLTPENVGEAIRTVRPYGVDVASGVEVEGSPGRKDRAKMTAFVRNSRQAADSFS